MAIEAMIMSEGIASRQGVAPSGGPILAEGAGGAGKSFESALASAVGELEGVQAVADQKSLALVTGQDVAVHDVMASVTEAEIAAQLTTAIAAKAIQAYQEIWRMEI